MQAAITTANSFAKAAWALAQKDIRVRIGVGAGASALFLFGVVMGGSLTPDFLQASPGTPEGPRAAIVFPAGEKDGPGIEVIDMSTSTVAEIIGSLPKANRFELMLYNGEIDESVRKAGVITVFVPMSSRFDYLPRGYIAGLSKRETKQLALSHIVERAVPLEESLNGTIITAGETFLDFHVDAGVNEATIGDANIVKAYKAKNGWVYLIDKVLVDAN